MNELIIKLYQDKPSRIGIQYSSGFQAGKEYTALLDKFKGELLRARIEINGDKLNLILYADASNAKVAYKDLTYNKAQFKKLQVFIKPNTELQFVHIYSKGNTLFIAKPAFSREMEFLLIQSFQLNVRGEFME